MILRLWDVTFSVADLERAADFYENVLGLQKRYQFSTYAGFDCGGVEIGLVPGRVTESPEDAPCVDFLVRDVDREIIARPRCRVRELPEYEYENWKGDLDKYYRTKGVQDE